MNGVVQVYVGEAVPVRQAVPVAVRAARGARRAAEVVLAHRHARITGRRQRRRQREVVAPGDGTVARIWLCVRGLDHAGTQLLTQKVFKMEKLHTDAPEQAVAPG